MLSVFDVPSKFRSGPFARAEALEAGISARVLEGAQFVRLHEAVYRHRDHEMTFADRVTAARIALPSAARTTGITRLQELGLDYGPRSPIHFVVAADHHLRISEVFLHRTVLMPASDELGVSVEVAFVAYCVQARVIDVIKVGSMLLHLGWMSEPALAALVSGQPWRHGCSEARWVIEHLDGRCRSMPEAELLTLIRFSGLPEPDVNAELRAPDGGLVIPDLWYAALRQAVEYEGSHHQQVRRQYVADIDRYLVFRTMRISYLQITKERLRRPRLAVRQVHQALVQAGYDGPGPDFGERWMTLFRTLSDVVRSPAPAKEVREPHSAA